MQLVQIGGHRDDFAGTNRKDGWWVGPAATAAGLIIFFGYLTFRAFQATYVWYDPYISPAVAPALFTPSEGYPGAVPVEHAWFGDFPSWWPRFIPMTPAFFFPWVAIAFRATCYYYRKAYYRSLFMSPPACSVRGVHRPYRGETSLLLFQNLHRYTLYLALLLLLCVWWETFAAFSRGGEFGMGVGTVVLVINALLLSGYTFGCHSWRHIIGGKMDCLTCDGRPTLRFSLWNRSTWFNGRHMQFAWLSLVWVAWTDLYILLVASGTIRDFNTWD